LEKQAENNPLQLVIISLTNHLEVNGKNIQFEAPFFRTL